MIEEKLYSIINRENTFIGEAPIAIDDCQWIRTTGGTTKVHFAKGNYDRPEFSIYARGINNAETLARIKAIFEAVRNYTDAVCEVIATRLPQFVGKDDKHRSVYVFQIQYQSGTY